ncbi:MAG: YlxR family protein [Myxococcales bacterium]|nr:YlxR family protein [Myxococcales bacterium]
MPLRKCVGCRQVKPQPELMRLAAENGQAVPGRHKPGRGCWLCRDASCAKAAVKSGAIPRALKGQAAAPELSRLMQWLTESEAAD